MERSEGFLNCQFSFAISAMSVPKEVSSSSVTSWCPSANFAEQFLVNEWNPLVSLEQDVNFNGSAGQSSCKVRAAQGNSSCNTAVVEQITVPSAFDKKTFPETASCFDLSNNNQIDLSAIDRIARAHSPRNFPSTNNPDVEKTIKTKKRKIMSNFGALQSHSPTVKVQIAESQCKNDVSSESTKSPREKDDKKQKSGLNQGANDHKSTQNPDASKEDYLHIRAKRGQATNSHSLAERVRREKISERMRVLQDLVPGCNKITGKAVMLDEIINYVQSLQRQVEFLSMKLATVHPELNFDIEQIPKDILHLRDGSSAIIGLGPGMTSSQHQLHRYGLMQSEMLMCNIPNSREMLRATFPEVSAMAQISSAWHDELQNVVQMGFIPNPPLSDSELNDTMKMDL